jgi:hypothetical protein
MTELSPEAIAAIEAAKAAYQAQLDAYEQEEADRWAALREAEVHCEEEMNRREEAYRAAMGEE